MALPDLRPAPFRNWCIGSGLGFYPRRSCLFASSICSWSGCSAGRRFRLLSRGSDATRLSAAFDPVTLYGRDPDRRPDISVSMTINGRAAILAMFLNTVIGQRLRAFAEEDGREPDDAEAAQVRAWVLANVRGTVQADILKEDHGQNTCIFSTEFALRCMADIQQWFTEHQVRNFYSVSISGYHRRSRREPDHPARVHARQQLHLHRGLPRPGHEHRRFRAQPLLLQRPGRRALG